DETHPPLLSAGCRGCDIIPDALNHRTSKTGSPLKLALTAACLLLIAVLSAIGQSGAKNGEWRTYGADLGNTHYSPVDQINATNFSKLQVAWRFKTESLGPRPETNLEATPLIAN